MRQTILKENFSSDHAGVYGGNTKRVERRQFLKALGVVGVLALFPRELIAQCTCNSEAGLWRDTVNGFIYKVADGRQASTMVSRLKQASVVQDNSYTNFHDYYASPLIFRGATVEPESVVCGNGFQVNRLPRYDAQYPCRPTNDLNAPEIQAVTNPVVIARVNCVLTPDGYRNPVDMNNSDHSTRYARAAAENGISYRDWHPPVYRRRFMGHGRSHTGYLLIHKNQTDSRGYRKTQLIVSSDI